MPLEQIVEKLLNPAVVWVTIPILAVLCWGVSSIIRALRGVPEEFEEFEQWKTAVEKLRARVDELERKQQGPSR